MGGTQRHRNDRDRPPRPDLRPTRAREIAAAKARSRALKASFVAFAALLFGSGMVVARHAYAGHAKEPSVPLSAPPRFVRVVKKNLLQAGVVGPAQAPPGATSAAS